MMKDPGTASTEVLMPSLDDENLLLGEADDPMAVMRCLLDFNGI